MDVLDRPCWRSTRSTCSRRVHVSSNCFDTVLHLQTLTYIDQCVGYRSIGRQVAGIFRVWGFGNRPTR